MAVVPKAMVSSDFTFIKSVPVSGDAKRVISLVTRNEYPLPGQAADRILPRSPEGTEWNVAGISN